MELRIKHSNIHRGYLMKNNLVLMNVLVVHNDHRAIVVPDQTESNKTTLYRGINTEDINTEIVHDSLVLSNGNLRSLIVIAAYRPELRRHKIQFYCDKDFYEEMQIKDFTLFKLLIK